MFLSPLRRPVLSEAIFLLIIKESKGKMLLELVKGTSSLHTASLLPHTPAWKSTFAGRSPKGKDQNNEIIQSIFPQNIQSAENM